MAVILVGLDCLLNRYGSTSLAFFGKSEMEVGCALFYRRPVRHHAEAVRVHWLSAYMRTIIRDSLQFWGLKSDAF
jgi:hypothetical protein